MLLCEFIGLAYGQSKGNEGIESGCSFISNAVCDWLLFKRMARFLERPMRYSFKGNS